MKKYLDGAGLKNVLGKVKEKLDLKADKSELAVQSNPNLLDNWYFVGGGSQLGGGHFPINQRGQTKYIGPCYTIDRWYINGYGKDKTLSVVEGGIHLTGEKGDDPPWGITVTQKIEQHFPLGTYTVSFLESDGKLYSYHFNYDGVGKKNYDAMYFHSLFSRDGYCEFSFSPSADRIGGATLSAIKLELGDHQTLAHQDAEGKWVLNDPPPDYGTELLKCQRYYHIFATADKRPAKKEDFCPPMRIDPTLTEIQINGQTYYAADANL